MWVNNTTGLRANRGDPDAIAEYFKPGEEPDDGNSMLGYETGAGTAARAEADGESPRAAAAPARAPDPFGPARTPGAIPGRGVY